MTGAIPLGRTGAHGAGRIRAAHRIGAAFGALALPLLVATPAAAAPTPGATAAATTEQPLQITLDGMEPRTVTPEAVITMSVRLSNTGDQPITHLQLRLQRGRVLGSRADLTAADKDPDPDTTVVAPFTSLPGQLEPGDSTTFAYSLPAAALQLGQDGVYPALLNANGTVGGGTRRVGELSTYLVSPPAAGTGQTQVAWLWPLVDRPHRDAAGRFSDDDLAHEITGNGRLNRVLAVLEKLPRTPSGAVPPVPVTVAVDPALIEDLQIMAAGPYQVGGSPGTGTQAAASFLQRLKAVTAGQTVVVLPYGDVDAGALEAAGLGSVITRSLPGTAEGTARDDRSTGNTTGAGGTPSASTGQDAGKGTGAGADIVAAALGVRPRTDVGWLPDGPVAAATLATYQEGGVSRVVLSSGALTDGDRALGLGSAPAAARTPVPDGSGTLDALVGDTELGGLADERRTAGGPRAAEQRYLAELALLSMHAPADPAAGTATVLAVPPREVDASPDDVAAMMTDATQQPWLRAAPLDTVSAGPAAQAGAPVAAPATSSLDPTGMAAVASAVAAREDLAGAATADPSAALAPYDAAIARSASLAWRDRPGPFRAAARAVAQAVGQLRDRVALVAPTDGTYTLASNDAPLVLTVRNDLTFAVRVLLRLGSRGAPGLDLGDIGEQTLAPGSRAILQVPTHLHRSGGFTVVATVTTPSGRPLGDPVQVTVKSTAYGSVSLIITLGAAVLLGLLFLRRLVRFALRRRRGRPGDEPAGPPAEGAAVPLPPTRSPV